MKPDERVSTQFRLSPELRQWLADAAESYGLPVNFLVAKLLSEALDNLVPADQFRFTRPTKETT